jgi:hypothetical protein
MADFDRSNLLKFLHEPRCLREIVAHFDVPTELVDCHLEEVVKSGEVLAYTKQSPLGVLNPNTNKLRSKGLLYMSSKRPLPAKDLASAKALPKTYSSPRKGSAHSSEKLGFMHTLLTHLKLDEARISHALTDLSSRMRLARSSRSARRLKWGKPKEPSEPRSLTHAERIRLFQALSTIPMPFLDIHRRFGISKRTVMGFVKRGLLEEDWGPKNIGLRFKLTDKGQDHLKRLEAASYLRQEERKRIFIRLKQRIFP